MEVGCIYSIRNTVNGKEYIGQTRHDPRKRFHVHKSVARGKSVRSFSLLHRAMQVHGEAAFVLETVEDGVPLARLDVRERYWIRERCSLVPCGYNIDKGGVKFIQRNPAVGMATGASHRGRKRPLSWRLAMSEGMRRAGAERRKEREAAGIIPFSKTGLARLARRAQRIPAPVHRKRGGHQRPSSHTGKDGRRPVRDLIARAYGYPSWKSMVNTKPGWDGEEFKRWKSLIGGAVSKGLYAGQSGRLYRTRKVFLDTDMDGLLKRREHNRARRAAA